jgi:thiosulfate/3-mercaptopyruvate sulfurtransferase
MATHCLIAVPELAQALADGRGWLLMDARFDLAQADAGERSHALAHIPGAVYAHLERDLSGPKWSEGGGFAGRHPLPDRHRFGQWLGNVGLVPERPVVVYDEGDGLFAARLWWMLRWMGHEPVRVLDGGLAHWKRLGLPLSQAVDSGEPSPWAPPYPEREPLEHPMSLAELSVQWHRTQIIDARAPERFEGRVEPLDPVAGHIPGARNRFYRENLAADGRFKPPGELRAQWQGFLGHGAVGRSLEPVHQCGSGVTACHNLLALRVAGLPTGRLYVGSWSQWCADPSRPVARSVP